MRVVSIPATLLAVDAQDLFLGKSDTDVELHVPRNKHTCVEGCLSTDEEDNFQKCNHDGSASCADSKCCQDESYTCFVKNAYWSACAPRCKTGVKDATGETWDCTPVSPSNCKTLQPCVEGCWDFEEESKALQLKAAEDWDCSAYADKTECIEHHISADAGLNKIWEGVCNDNCPDVAPKVCPKSSFTKCVNSCAGESIAPQHGDSCEKDGRTSCKHSRCCSNPSDTCFTKNPYWAACTSTCEAGKKNPLDSMVWDCKELKPRKTCDPYLYRSCVATCLDQC